MNNRDRRWYQSRIHQLDKRIAELEEALTEAKILLEQRDRRIVGLENRIAELEEASTLYYDANEALRERIAELKGLIDEVIALDPLFPDELMDRLKGVE